MTAEELIESGRGERCLVCQGVSAYAWSEVSEEEGIAHIGTSSCWEWQCGHCGTRHVERGSPIDHPAYTHRDDDDEEED